MGFYGIAWRSERAQEILDGLPPVPAIPADPDAKYRPVGP